MTERRRWQNSSFSSLLFPCPPPMLVCSVQERVWEAVQLTLSELTKSTGWEVAPHMLPAAQNLASAVLG